jgi:ABC-type transport system involved in multi-copper enzyme maturation permease subunit
MSGSLLTLYLLSTLMCALQLAAALPWLAAFDAKMVKALLLRPANLGWMALSLLVAGAVLALALSANSDPGVLARLGRVYGSILHLQLTADVFVLVFAGLMLYWPKGGAVALAAFRESLRQPMFWLLALLAVFFICVAIILPYFTLGEDYKMSKELCYEIITLFTALFAILSAAISVSDEIEGRTAVTLMSKPVSRRHFLLGKFGGILLAALVMNVLLGWFTIWVLIFKEWWDPGFYRQFENIPDPQWIVQAVASYVPQGEAAAVARGFLLWVDHAAEALPKLVIVSGQVMVLLAIATALATRLPMIVNLAMCLLFYLLGHLTPILTAVSQNRFRLVAFMAQVFDTVLPGLEHFHLGTAILRDTEVPPGDFAIYALNITLYAITYSAIALLFGLILFEDRDLA